MSAVAYLHRPQKPRLAPVAPFRLHPRITLEFCGWCHGRGKYVVARRDFPCTQCNGHGSIVTDNA